MRMRVFRDIATIDQAVEVYKHLEFAVEAVNAAMDVYAEPHAAALRAAYIDRLLKVHRSFCVILSDIEADLKLKFQVDDDGFRQALAQYEYDSEQKPEERMKKMGMN